jgi:hypothetical protein
MLRSLCIVAVLTAVMSGCLFEAAAFVPEPACADQSHTGCADCSECGSCQCCPLFSVALPSPIQALDRPIEVPHTPLLYSIPVVTAAPVDIFHPPKA